MKKRSYVVLSALITTHAFAAATGLVPLTPKELKRMQRELGMKKVKEVRPSTLGLSRVNRERVRRGGGPLPAETARPFGRDTVTDPDLDNDFESAGNTGDVSTEAFGGVLPAAVDNSTLAAFPSIGQQAWNSCVGWAMGYYQWSHNNGVALGWNSKTDATKKCSPKHIYTMINGGVDNGAYFSDAFNMLQKHGCISWANFPEDNNYRAWNTNPDHWRAGLSFRSNAVQYVYNLDTQAGLDQAKQLLTNGYVLTYGTYINSWVFTTVKANPNAGANPLAGQQALLYVNGTNGSHAMTLVGYDDNAWVDVNGNNAVDAGELGVFKIANSWGTGWRNGGYAYVPYDALKPVSAVAGGPFSGRQPAFQSRLAYHQPPRAQSGVAYRPRYLAKFTVNHGARNQLSLRFGHSSAAGTAATTTITPFALMNKGGAYAFNGTTTAVPATFVMDVTDLPIVATGDNRLYLTLSDNTAGSAATVSSFELIDLVNNTQSAAALASAVATDASSATVSLVHNPTVANQPPVAVAAANVTGGVTPLTVSFDAGASYDNDGTIADYSWSFGEGTIGAGAYVSKTYSAAGTYMATLTVRDDDGAAATTAKIITVTAPTTTPTGDTTAPTVTLTNPVNGARYSRWTYFTATATAADNVGVTKVNFYYNGYLKCTDTTAPYSCQLRMGRGTSVPVKATAYDAAGNVRSMTNYITN
jgi:PKD repeat protein